MNAKKSIARAPKSKRPLPEGKTERAPGPGVGTRQPADNTRAEESPYSRGVLIDYSQPDQRSRYFGGKHDGYPV